MKLPLTISKVQEGLKSGDYSCVDLVDMHLGRIRAVDHKLNAFITVTDNYAYDLAKKHDNTIANDKKAFENFPLLGVITSLKDVYLTEGIETTAGSNVLRGYAPQYSSTVVKKLEAAGAIIIGKTNLDAWAHGASGENSDFGSTKNPWHLDMVPGGSSSGSAVSVAAQMATISMGTDTGGSVRLPASFCGVTGFKSTYGTVSRYGVVSMASSLDSMGHFTHTVDDAEKVFNIIKGTDSLDSTLSDRSTSLKKSYKIGLAKEYFEKGIDVQILQSIEEVRDLFEGDGIEFVDVSLPHTKYGISAYYIIMPAEVSSNLGRYDGVRYGAGRDALGEEAKRRIMMGTHVLSSGYAEKYYLKAQKIRTLIREDFDSVFTKVDAVIGPVSPTPAFQLGERVEDPIEMYLADILTVNANLAGLPAISIPSGFTSSGLPVSYQLIGPHYSENILFSLGKLYQEKTSFHTKTPTI